VRSKLFVPGSRPELFPKALAGPADALSFDLEDAVTESRKAEARAAVAALLCSPEAAASAKVLIVRVNGCGSAHFAADVQAVVTGSLGMLNLPKPESVDEVRFAADAVEKAERANGVAPGTVKLLVNVESPRGLRLAADLAGAHPRVAGLQLGFGDLFEPLQIARRDVRNVHAAMFAVRMAAGEAGVFAYDTAFADVADTEGYLEEAQMSRALGYIGKSCIHPSQVALAHRVFRPSDEEIARARRIVAAAREAEAKGVGAYMVDGSMVDAPFVRRAEAILADAEALGLD
jgi:citrate lyase subunit beta/citryl-CoA lyase